MVQHSQNNTESRKAEGTSKPSPSNPRRRIISKTASLDITLFNLAGEETTLNLFKKTVFATQGSKSAAAAAAKSATSTGSDVIKNAESTITVQSDSGAGIIPKQQTSNVRDGSNAENSSSSTGTTKVKTGDQQDTGIQEEEEEEEEELVVPLDNVISAFDDWIFRWTDMPPNSTIQTDLLNRGYFANGISFHYLN